MYKKIALLTLIFFAFQTLHADYTLKAGKRVKSKIDRMPKGKVADMHSIPQIRHFMPNRSRAFQNRNSKNGTKNLTENTLNLGPCVNWTFLKKILAGRQDLSLKARSIKQMEESSLQMSTKSGYAMHKCIKKTVEATKRSPPEEPLLKHFLLLRLFTEILKKQEKVFLLITIKIQPCILMSHSIFPTTLKTSAGSMSEPLTHLAG